MDENISLNQVESKPTSTISGLELKKLSLEVWGFLKNHQEIIFASLVGLISLFYFLVTAYSTLFEEVFPGFRIRIFGLAVGLIVTVVSFLAIYFTNNNLVRKVLLFLQSLSLLFFSFSYFLSIENRAFYPIILAILPAFIFFIHITLFTRKWVNIYTTLAQILLFCLQTFSLLTFFDFDRVAARSFSQDSLSTFFGLPEIFWLIVCAFGITVVSVNYFKISTLKLNLWTSVLVFWLVIQVLYITQAIVFRNFFYWEKTLIFIIVWDFLLAPLKIILNNIQDDKYRPRLSVSTLYHVFLILLVFIFVLV